MRLDQVGPASMWLKCRSRPLLVGRPSNKFYPHSTNIPLTYYNHSIDLIATRIDMVLLIECLLTSVHIVWYSMIPTILYTSQQLEARHQHVDRFIQPVFSQYLHCSQVPLLRGLQVVILSTAHLYLSEFWIACITTSRFILHPNFVASFEVYVWSIIIPPLPSFT